MANSLFNKSDYDSIVSRINKLSADSKNQWGKMTVNEMMCHVTDPFRDVMNTRNVKPSVPGFLRPLAKKFIITAKPWKHNLQTLKLYKQGGNGKGTKPTNFDTDKEALLDFVSKFYSTDKSYEFGPHGGLGKLSREENGFLMWKHLDHHLSSFGV